MYAEGRFNWLLCIFHSASPRVLRVIYSSTIFGSSKLVGNSEGSAGGLTEFDSSGSSSWLLASALVVVSGPGRGLGL